VVQFKIVTEMQVPLKVAIWFDSHWLWLKAEMTRTDAMMKTAKEFILVN